jgi:adenosylcobinamide-phosphate synthase
MRRVLGAASLVAVVTPFVALSWALSAIPYMGAVIGTVFLYLGLGVSRILEQTSAIARALQDNDLVLARQAAQALVTRDTDELNEGDLSTAAVEVILKGGCEGLMGALLWFAAAGAPGVVLYRLVAEVNRQWGYSTSRYRHFGWASTRLHAILNWLPARITAVSYGLLGDRASAWRSWRSQTSTHNSSEGPLLAAGAGALNLQLGGPVRYFGHLVVRPPLGEGVVPRSSDIGRALDLLARMAAMWMALILGVAWWLP